MQNPKNKPLVSVIVPTFNESANIRKILQSLFDQSYGPNHFEIIIADNNSSDDTREIVQNLKHPNLTMVLEASIANPDAARNKALAVARGEIFAFTDGDCVADSQWLEKGVRGLIEEKADLLAGRVDFSHSNNPGLSQLYDSVSFLQHDISVSRRGIAFTCNLFVRREVFAKIPNFQVVSGWNGDSWFTKKATSLDFKLVYGDDAVVQHPSRSLRPLLKKIYRIGLGQSQNLAVDAEAGNASIFNLMRSKPHLLNLNPFFLRRRAQLKHLKLGPIRFFLLWLFGYFVLSVAAYAAASGFYLRHQIKFLWYIKGASSKN